ncbi:MAG: prepilin-type N-terminal cleavage/methylation domain-containing protein [Spartobacteria bacterium]|nr:prepilin-type N-terminal cleavage/methylation domain-containing protein [Spartobacteria bacterium]
MEMTKSPFPMYGKAAVKSSNHWNFPKQKFQSLELFLRKRPAIGTFCKNPFLRQQVIAPGGVHDYMQPELNKKSTHRTAAFTLIELMTAMAILSIIILFMVQLFDKSTKAVSQGTSNMQITGNVRAVLDLISEELSTAMVDTNFTFNVMWSRDDLEPYGLDAESYFKSFDHVGFMALTKNELKTTNDLYREEQAIKYYVDKLDETNAMGDVYTTYELKRASYTAGDIIEKIYALGNASQPEALSSMSWYELYVGSSDLLKNITAFHVQAFDMGGNNLLTNYPDVTSLSESPAYVDIYLSILPERALNQVRLMHNAGAESVLIDGVIATNEQAFFQRVFLRNRHHLGRNQDMKW